MEAMYDSVFKMQHLTEESSGINGSFVDLQVLISLAVHADNSPSKLLILYFFGSQALIIY